MEKTSGRLSDPGMVLRHGPGHRRLANRLLSTVAARFSQRREELSSQDMSGPYPTYWMPCLLSDKDDTKLFSRRGEGTTPPAAAAAMKQPHCNDASVL